MQTKAQNSEISTKALDLRGLLGSLGAVEIGLPPYQAVQMGITNKAFDIFEKEIVSDMGHDTHSGRLDEGECILMPDEEYRYELENRMKNLLWTVSGDYALEVSLDIDSFQRSKYISLYDAVKQGALRVSFLKMLSACTW